ncbi:CRISPR-associated endoribonuclease Cas6 [Anaerovorax odorimutans]|uniref:CRISPR-associated endoribonuclease Cas6 n=1 Tax=Anaerovorax odorimutans TaxID=109327 RepID=A0ABT1RLM1_9FIRM|nr:CRISPR-associated endoribonuclease Cas6 [Anaerovorax odorimutans]MCQ4636094.1 CRISPR-associated endoribonuclease Cas6 [Anaerovorax odorimutans]
MKLSIEFTLTKKEFPLDFRRVFLALLKKCLAEADNGKYMDKYYEAGKEKDFTFAVFFSEPVFRKTHIELKAERGKLLFSCAETFTGFLFFSAFLEQRGKAFPLEKGNHLTIQSVKKVAEPETKESQAMVKMLSPLCVREHKREKNWDQYYIYDDEDFQKKALYVIKNKLLRAGFSEELSETFKITPVNCKKTVVEFYKRKIPCSLGYFLLEGDRAVLNYLLRAGLASRCSAGFGMPELK